MLVGSLSLPELGRFSRDAVGGREMLGVYFFC